MWRWNSYAVSLGGLFFLLMALYRQRGPGVFSWPTGTLRDGTLTFQIYAIGFTGGLAIIFGTAASVKQGSARNWLGILVGILLFLSMAYVINDAKIRGWRSNDYSNVRCLPNCAIAMYAEDYHGWLPNDLGQLVDLSYTGGGHLVAPHSGTASPRTGDEVRAGQCDYEYHGGGVRRDIPDADKAIMLVSKSRHVGDWVSIAFVNGRTTCIRRNRLQDTVAQRKWFYPRPERINHANREQED